MALGFLHTAYEEFAGVLSIPSELQIAAKYVMSPPIRSEENQKQIRGGLAGGSLQLIATDHAVFNISQKAHGFDDFRKIPNGVNGIEVRFQTCKDS